MKLGTLVAAYNKMNNVRENLSTITESSDFRLDEAYRLAGYEIDDILSVFDTLEKIFASMEVLDE